MNEAIMASRRVARLQREQQRRREEDDYKKRDKIFRGQHPWWLFASCCFLFLFALGLLLRLDKNVSNRFLFDQSKRLLIR